MFAILGPVRVESGTTQVAITARRELVLLGMLLLHANSSVSTTQLVEAIWAGQPPVNARNQVQQCVRLLRRRLAEAGIDRPVIVTEPGGYRARLEAADLDLYQFRRLVDRARSRCSGGDLARAREDYRAALALWRGAALPDLDSDPIRAAAAVLDQEHTQVIEERLKVELDLGGAGELVAELTDLVVHHPYRERLHHALMLALYRAGRQADALAAYQRARRMLCDELGVEPGQPLQQLHHDILHHHPRLQPPPQQSPARQPPAAVVPRELPADITGFTGRGQELAILDNLVPEGENPTGPVVISAIDGMAGIGKTALAVHAAHQLAHHYPDGQLFVDLHGYTQGIPPLQAGEVLERILRTLGIPGERIPAELDQRAALYRSRLADKKLLILLDNAATETELTPLLPGGPGCLVLVTSRRRLIGLDATHMVSLDVLPLADAVTLFTRTLGGDRLADEPAELLAEVVELCGRLPLAIRIAAARLRTHPSWHLTHVARRLRDQQHRLTELDTGQRSITAALDLSYQQLAPDQGDMYRLLGLHPGPDIEPYAAAALAGTTLDHASHLLDQLHEAHLLLEPVHSRYRFHDLIRAHATHTATTNETEPKQREALTRLLDHYRHTASIAMDVAYPYERERRPRVPSACTPTPNLPNLAMANSWLDVELPNLLAAAGHAADNGLPEHTVHLSATLHRHLRTRGHFRNADTLHNQALDTARATGDRTGELDALLGLGLVYLLRGRPDQAADHVGQALEIAQTISSRQGEVDALTGLGLIYRQQGQHQQARHQFEQAWEIARTTGDRTGELEPSICLGWIHGWQGRHEQAAAYLVRVLEIARTIGHRTGELYALTFLGHILRLQGRHEEALDRSGQALEIARNIGSRPGELETLLGLGHINRLQGRNQQAANHYQQALDLAREIGDRNWQFEALHGMGRLHQADSHPETALAHHHQALELATHLRQPADQARAYDGLAHAHHSLNLHPQARQNWQRALDILTELGTDHTDSEETNTHAIRTHLANLDKQQNHPRTAQTR